MFELRFTAEAKAIIEDMEAGGRYQAKLGRVRACLARLADNPRHPGLRAHRYRSRRGPHGEDAWEVYVENRVPSAWRIWFYYGPRQGLITILTIGPHP